MKIYVVQYDASASPVGKVVAVRATLVKAMYASQEYEDQMDHAPEKLTWPNNRYRRHGPWFADGYSGEYTIREWEVAP